MYEQYPWYSRHKSAVDTVARCLSIEVSELLPVLDKKIGRTQSSASSGRRALDITIQDQGLMDKRRYPLSV